MIGDPFPLILTVAIIILAGLVIWIEGGPE